MAYNELKYGVSSKMETSYVYIYICICMLIFRLENYNHYLKDLLSFHYVTQQQRENPVEEKEFR